MKRKFADAPIATWKQVVTKRAREARLRFFYIERWSGFEFQLGYKFFVKHVTFFTKSRIFDMQYKPLTAINPCVMDGSGEKTLTIGKSYKIKQIAIDGKYISITDDSGNWHQYSFESLFDFFQKR